MGKFTFKTMSGSLEQNFITQPIKSLLNPNLQFEELKEIIDSIHVYFHQKTQISGFEVTIENLAAIPASKGKAVGLNHAAQCLLDYHRTHRFILAIHQAILDQQKSNPGKTINLFYAGCGPYAPLMTLIAPLFRPDEIQFSLLEINRNSIDSAKKLIKEMGLNRYVPHVYLEDATTFQIPNAESYDILISETLDALLYRECYVPILMNMLPQFKKEGVLIPENVSIDLQLKKGGTETKQGVIFDVRKSISELTEKSDQLSKFPEKVFKLCSILDENSPLLLMDTKVHIYKDHELNRNESSLTVLYELPYQKTDSISFTYYLEPEVELRYQFRQL